MKKQENVELGKRVAYIRKNILGYTQKQLAENLGISREELSRIERGLIAISSEYAEKILSLSSVSWLWLYEGGEPILQKDFLREKAESDVQDQKDWLESFVKLLREDAGFSVKRNASGDYIIVPGSKPIKNIMPMKISEQQFLKLVDLYRVQVDEVRRTIGITIINSYYFSNTDESGK